MPFGKIAKTALLNSWINLITSKMHHSVYKIIFVLGADEYLERLEGKVKKCLIFCVKIWEKTVWMVTHFLFLGRNNICASQGGFEWRRRGRKGRKGFSHPQLIPFLKQIPFKMPGFPNLFPLTGDSVGESQDLEWDLL